MTRTDPADRVAVVTGAASGIGAALVDAFLDTGARVAATGRTYDKLVTRATERGWPADRVLLLHQDVRDAPRWDAVLDEVEAAFGPVDVLVNNAGVVRPAWILDTSVEDVAAHLDNNARGAILGTRAAARRMRVRGRGHIVNMSSLAGVAPTPGLSLYSASKAAIRLFSLAANQELRPHGVAVTVICPDAVDTPMARMELGHPEAALVFSRGRMMPAARVAKVIVGRVLRRRPPEVTLPHWRGLLSRLSALLPRLSTAGTRWFAALGDRARRRLQATHPRGGSSDADVGRKHSINRR